MLNLSKTRVQVTTWSKNNTFAFWEFWNILPKTQNRKTLALQGFPKRRNPFFEKIVRKTGFVHMELVRGFEPLAYWLRINCATTAPHQRFIWEPMFHRFYFTTCFFSWKDNPYGQSATCALRMPLYDKNTGIFDRNRDEFMGCLHEMPHLFALNWKRNKHHKHQINTKACRVMQTGKARRCGRLLESSGWLWYTK